MQTCKHNVLIGLFLLLFLATPALADITGFHPQGFGGICPRCEPLEFDRTLLTENIAHYQGILRVGPGEFDRIRIHRIVREEAPNRPAKLREAVLLAHGINVGFVGTYMTNLGVDGVDPAHNLPVFLAQNEVDVWGLDFRWILVPAATKDIGFMADWGLERDAEDLDIALNAARWGRIKSGSGGDKIDLVGFSRGARISYTYLNDETELPPGRRHVKRYIAFDAPFKTLDQSAAQNACVRAEQFQALIDSGEVANNIQVLGLLGQLAISDPEGPSPVFTGFTNRQAALVFGTLPPGGTGTFHAFAGLFENSFPVGLRYTQEEVGLNLFAGAAAYQPWAGQRDLLRVVCNDGTTELDDHLADIAVPVFYLGAAGGSNTGGLDTLAFLENSSEKQSLIVRLMPEGQELFDVGHADVLTMEGAAELVWQPILHWLTR